MSIVLDNLLIGARGIFPAKTSEELEKIREKIEAVRYSFYAKD